MPPQLARATALRGVYGRGRGESLPTIDINIDDDRVEIRLVPDRIAACLRKLARATALVCVVGDVSRRDRSRSKIGLSCGASCSACSVHWMTNVAIRASIVLASVEDFQGGFRTGRPSVRADRGSRRVTAAATWHYG